MRIDPDKERTAECVKRTIAWLHEVWSLVEEGRLVQVDPFYPRNDLLTPEVVKAVIDDMEALFVSELKKFPAYHRNAQGISASEYLIPPGFDKMAAGEQLAVVQGIDKIFQDYRVDD